MRGYLGSSARGGRAKSGGRSKRGNGGENKGRSRRKQPAEQPNFDEDDFGTFAEGEFQVGENAMNLSDLKKRPVAELVELAQSMGLENTARLRKQDIIFAVLKAHARNGEDIYGDGVLEILQDGFGFLRSADSSYLAGPDDIYVCAPAIPSRV